MTAHMNMDFIAGTSNTKSGSANLQTTGQSNRSENSFRHHLADETNSQSRMKNPDVKHSQTSKSQNSESAEIASPNNSINEKNSRTESYKQKNSDNSVSSDKEINTAHSWNDEESEAIGKNEVVSLDPMLSEINTINSNSIEIEQTSQFDQSLENIPYQGNSAINLSVNIDTETYLQSSQELVDNIVKGSPLTAGKNLPINGNNLPYHLENAQITKASSEIETDFGFLSDSLGKANEKQAFFEQAINNNLLKNGNNELLIKGDSKSDVAGDMKTLASINSHFQATQNQETSSELAGKLNSTEKTETLPQFSLRTPISDSRWNNQLADRVRWMNNSKISAAEIQLHPEELGKIEIKIQTIDDQTTVSFISKNQATREMLELSMPRLKELLNNNGLELEHSDISENSFSENNDNSASSHASNTEIEMNELNADETDSFIRRAFSHSDGVVDRYV